MKIDINELTIQKIHKMMSVGDITCEELTKAYIERIENLDKTENNINSVILINPDDLIESPLSPYLTYSFVDVSDIFFIATST